MAKIPALSAWQVSFSIFGRGMCTGIPRAKHCGTEFKSKPSPPKERKKGFRKESLKQKTAGYSPVARIPVLSAWQASLPISEWGMCTGIPRAKHRGTEFKSKAITAKGKKKGIPKGIPFSLEVTAGFEPADNGVADRGLTTWLRHQVFGCFNIIAELFSFVKCFFILFYAFLYFWLTKSCYCYCKIHSFMLKCIYKVVLILKK